MADFKKLEDALAKAKSPIVRHFNPGITEDAILKHLQKLQMEPIEDLVDLYKSMVRISLSGDFAEFK